MCTEERSIQWKWNDFRFSFTIIDNKYQTNKSEVVFTIVPRIGSRFGANVDF